MTIALNKKSYNMCSKLPPWTAIHLSSRLQKLLTMITHPSTVISSQAWGNAGFSCRTVAYRVAETFSSRMVHRVVHRVEIWRVGRPNILSPKAGKQLFAGGDCWVGRMRQCPVLLKRESGPSAATPRAPGHHGELVADGGIDFGISFDEDQWCLPVGANSGPSQNENDCGRGLLLAFFWATAGDSGDCKNSTVKITVCDHRRQFSQATT